MYQLTYKKPAIIFITFIGIAMLTLSIAHFLGLYDAGGPPYYQLVFGLLVIGVLPFSVYRSANKNYNSNQRLTEVITYEFDHERVRIEGESFNSELTWPKTHKVLELKDWVLIYQNKLVANVIPKESFSSQQLTEFRQLVNSLTEVKSKLKKD